MPLGRRGRAVAPNRHRERNGDGTIRDHIKGIEKKDKEREGERLEFVRLGSIVPSSALFPLPQEPGPCLRDARNWSSEPPGPRSQQWKRNTGGVSPNTHTSSFPISSPVFLVVAGCSSVCTQGSILAVNGRWGENKRRREKLFESFCLT